MQETTNPIIPFPPWRRAPEGGSHFVTLARRKSLFICAYPMCTNHPQGGSGGGGDGGRILFGLGT